MTSTTKQVPQSAVLFFKKAEILDVAAHGDLKLRKDAGYKHAEKTHLIPVNAVELPAASRHYPILFSGRESGMPIVMVGLNKNKNLFVNDDGGWGDGCYIPAFVRRYPFVLLQDSLDPSGHVNLCIDAKSSLFDAGDGDALFENGQPSKTVVAGAKFAASYAREQTRTHKFVQACLEEELLVSRTVNVENVDGEHMEVKGFRIIDTEKFKNLSPETVNIWWQRGWLGLVFAHMNSLGNFGRLYHRNKR